MTKVKQTLLHILWSLNLQMAWCGCRKWLALKNNRHDLTSFLRKSCKWKQNKPNLPGIEPISTLYIKCCINSFEVHDYISEICVLFNYLNLMILAAWIESVIFVPRRLKSHWCSNLFTWQKGHLVSLMLFQNNKNKTALKLNNS